MNKKVIKMNKKVIMLSIVVVGVVVVCVLAMLYAPNMLEALLRLHRIPQH